MRWTWRLGHVNGAPVEVHWLFALLVGWAAYTGWSTGQIAGLLYSTGLLLALFGCVLLHEIGHSLQAQALGIPVRRILLMPFGGLAQLERVPDRPQDELRVGLAGPVTNLGLGLIAGALFLAWQAASGLRLPPVLAAVLVLRRAQPGAQYLLAMLTFVNMGLVVFNLIPAFPLDGGRILRSLLALILPRPAATRIVASLGWMVGITCLLLGGTLGRWWGEAAAISLVFIGATAVLGTGAEESFQRNEAALHGIAVRAAVRQPTWCLRPAEVLTPALVSAITTVGRSVLPVADGPRLIGILTSQAAAAALARNAPTTVEQVMQTDYPRVEADADLWHAQQLMVGAGWQALPVVNGGELYGMLTADTLREAAALAPVAKPGIEPPHLISPGEPGL